MQEEYQSARLNKSISAFYRRFFYLPALEAFSHHRSFHDSWKRQQGLDDSKISYIDLLVEIINEGITLSNCSIHTIESVSLENQLNSRIHTTGLFNLDSRHHPLAVD